MNIVPQNYNNLLKNIFLEAFKHNLDNNLNVSNNPNNVLNFINIISNLDNSLCDIARNTISTYFQSIDYSFKISLERKRKYEIKSFHKRTILTIFGEVTFYRTFYKSKLTNENFCFVDRHLGLHKYDYFDPYIKSLVIDYASNNSFSKTAKYINDLIGNRVSIKQKIKYLSRQSIRNIILSSNISNTVINPSKHEIDTLFIIADEKWIHTQNNKNKNVMEKSVVVFENIINKRLYKKQIFASINNSYLNNSIDYIYNTYDISKIKNIFVMGDGAPWIKKLKYEYKLSNNINVYFGLDKFHFKQALHHICLNKNLENILTSYVLNNNKNDFKEVCNSLIFSSPYRKDTIESKMNYILNNWNNIHILYKYNLSCPMESQISHNIADLFTSRPKAYSIRMINKLTEIRLHFKNNHDLKELYLNNFNSNTTLTINKGFLNFNIFDHFSQYNFLNNKIYNPTF